MAGKNLEDDVSMLDQNGDSNRVSEAYSFCASKILSFCRSSRSSITVSCSQATSPLNPSQAIASQSHAFIGKRAVLSHPQPDIAVTCEHVQKSLRQFCLEGSSLEEVAACSRTECQRHVGWLTMTRQNDHLALRHTGL